ncbi:hypothetical protein ACIBF1_37985 [Spirillospora sp. NPDC050679]
MTETAHPGTTDYQLYLLRTMPDDHPEVRELVERALGSLRADRYIMEDAYRRISDLKLLVHPGSSRVRPVFELVSDLLGEPVKEGARTVDGQECLARSFRLPLWKDFLFEISGDSDGVLWDERFVREGGAPPSVSSPSQISSWSMTKTEIESRFGPLEELEVWPPYSAYALPHRSPDEGGTKRELVFFWSLFQHSGSA